MMTKLVFHKSKDDQTFTHAIRRYNQALICLNAIWNEEMRMINKKIKVTFKITSSNEIFNILINIL